MDLSPNEAQIVALLERVRVMELVKLAEQLDVSTKTVQRALSKAGYVTSLNFNGTFVTLQKVPEFDDNGLWSFQQVHFSRHGSLQNTLAQLIDNAVAGYTLRELEDRVGTRVHNHLSQLIRQGRVNRFLLGKHAVYLSARPRQARTQEVCRRAAQPPSTPQAAPDTIRMLPAGLDALTVIQVLVRLLQTPQASVASVARLLQAAHTKVRAEDIRQILDFYGLKKTTR